MNEQAKIGENCYTVSEIDAMRDLLAELVIARGMRATGRCTAANDGGIGWDDRYKQAERELRTHMLNGTKSEEIKARLREEQQRLQNEWRAFAENAA